jgi:hypothetical protein
VNVGSVVTGGLLLGRPSSVRWCSSLLRPPQSSSKVPRSAGTRSVFGATGTKWTAGRHGARGNGGLRITWAIWRGQAGCRRLARRRDHAPAWTDLAFRVPPRSGRRGPMEGRLARCSPRRLCSIRVACTRGATTAPRARSPVAPGLDVLAAPGHEQSPMLTAAITFARGERPRTLQNPCRFPIHDRRRVLSLVRTSGVPRPRHLCREAFSFLDFRFLAPSPDPLRTARGDSSLATPNWRARSYHRSGLRAALWTTPRVAGCP